MVTAGFVESTEDQEADSTPKVAQVKQALRRMFDIPEPLYKMTPIGNDWCLSLLILDILPKNSLDGSKVYSSDTQGRASYYYDSIARFQSSKDRAGLPRNDHHIRVLRTFDRELPEPFLESGKTCTALFTDFSLSSSSSLSRYPTSPSTTSPVEGSWLYPYPFDVKIYVDIASYPRLEALERKKAASVTQDVLDFIRITNCRLVYLEVIAVQSCEINQTACGARIDCFLILYSDVTETFMVICRITDQLDTNK
ncbi:hypothetical protein BGX29_005506 [Mortierella sp. GBA35]|nr:hypothetical protein BGX29_005506 [Mortierella sp. GBA35]